MRRNSLRKSTISPLAQKIKVSQHLLRLKNEEDGFDEQWSGRLRLPSLPRQKSWRDNDNVLSNENSLATSVSWSQEAEDVATQKLEKQWATVEKSFYEEDDQLPHGSVLDECVQWRTQIPYLRIVGKSPVCVNNILQHDSVGSASDERAKKFDTLQSDRAFLEHDLSGKERGDSAQYKLNKAKFEDVLDLLMEYVTSELFLSKENKTDSLCDSLSDSLKIAPAPLNSNRNSSRNSKTNWTEEAISPNYIENKSLSIRNRLLDTESSLQTMRNDANYQGIQKKQRNSVSANKPKDFDDTGDDDASRSKDKLCAPHIGRNKLGTVFNERIIVSPVPFTVSTRESFSTLKTIPIRFMNENMEVSFLQESVRDVSGFQDSARKSNTLRNSYTHSAWQPPICPTIWPKNIRLAPIDTSKFSNSRNRSLAPSPRVFDYSRKPLSPISHSTIPRSAHATRDHRNRDFLAIQGKHIVPAQSSKISLLSAGWDYNPRVSKHKKKKARAKEGT
ncbi:hypothetical protein HN011_005189 [Eciton burchellii]|nr:hypothetical protein HN011_005189 [Eciton burchellii]